MIMCSRNKKGDSFPLPDMSADTGKSHDIVPDPVGVAAEGGDNEGEEGTVKKKNKKGKSRSNKKLSKVTILWLPVYICQSNVKQMSLCAEWCEPTG